MDIAIQLRSAELVLKFLKHDVQSIPPYGYKVQKLPYLPAGAGKRLQRSSPEAEGVPSAAIGRLFARVGAEADTIAAHGMLLMRHGRVIAEGAWAPYRTDVPHMLYSMSKSITGTAVGMAVEEGLLSLDERLIDIFPEYTNAAQAKILRGHTVRHLLTMSTGCRFNEVGSMLDSNWAKMFMESVPKFEAGAAFEYNSLNSYMLAAILVRRAGMSLTAYLTPRLYEPLGIASHEWETCPEGIEKGGWGLSLTLEDSAKIGQLYLNGGMWEGKRILSESWVREATRPQIATPNGELKHGYGYQIWMSDSDGAFQFNGAFGQYVIVMPEKDAVAVIFSGSARLFAQGSLMAYLDECFAEAEDAPLIENAGAAERLGAALGTLRFEPSVPEGLGADKNEFRHICSQLDGREYRLESNIGGLFPQSIQAVHGNYTYGTDMLRFEKTEVGLKLIVYERTERNAVELRADGGVAYGSVAMRQERQRTGTRALWRLTPEGIRLAILISLIETPDTRILLLEIKQNKLTVTFDEAPALDKTVGMLFELVGASNIAYVKRLIEQARIENVDAMVHSITRPTVAGTLITANDEL